MRVDWSVSWWWIGLGGWREGTRCADAAVHDFDVNIVVFETVGLERLVLEVAFKRIFIKAHPAFEFIVG